MSKSDIETEGGADGAPFFVNDEVTTEPSVGTDLARESKDTLLKPLALDKKERKEQTASWLAIGLFALLCVEILLYLVASFYLTDISNIQQVMQLVFPATAGLLGTASGYYFASKE